MQTLLFAIAHTLILAAFFAIAYRWGRRSVPHSLTAEWHLGYEQGVKAASIGVTRDAHGRFAKVRK